MSFSRVGGARPLLLSFRACGPFAGSGKGTKRGPARKGGNKGVKGGNPYCFSCPINPSSLPPYASPLSPSFPLSRLLHRQHTPVVHPLPSLTPAILNPLATPFSVARFVNLGPAVLYGTHVRQEYKRSYLSDSTGF